VWSWWQPGSVHATSWPEAAELSGEADSPEREREQTALALAADVLREVRKAKSTQKVSLATAVDQVHVVDTAVRLAALEAARQDVCDAGKIAKLEVEVGQQFSVRVELAEAPA